MSNNPPPQHNNGTHDYDNWVLLLRQGCYSNSTSVFFQSKDNWKNVGGAFSGGDPETDNNYSILGTFIDNPEFKHEIISATAPAGTLLIFDGRTFHGTGKNLTENKRHAIFTYFCRTYIRQQENHFLSLPEEIRATSSDEFLDRLGFGTFRGLGAVEGNMEHGTKDKESVRGIERKIQSRPKNIIGELS